MKIGKWPGFDGLPGRWIWPGMVLIIAAMTAACTPEPPLRIGFLGGISGRWADMGNVARDAVQLAVDQRNRSGGVDARPVELLIRDDRQDAGRAEQATRDLIAQGSAALIGPMTSSMGAVVSPIANRAGVAVVSPTVTSEAFSRQDDHFFRVTATTSAFAARGAGYLLGKGAVRRVAVAYLLDNRVYTEDWLARFREVYTAGGGRIVAEVPFLSDGAASYQKIAQDLLANRPEGVLIIANSTDSALLCHQLRRLDALVPITLSDWGGTERLVELGGRAVEGVTMVHTFNRASTAPAYQEFRHAFLQRFRREPGAAGMYAYEAANLVLDALTRRREGEDLKAVLLTMGTIRGLQGDFRLDAYGDADRALATISMVRNGEFVVVD